MKKFCWVGKERIKSKSLKAKAESHFGLWTLDFRLLESSQLLQQPLLLCDRLRLVNLIYESLDTGRIPISSRVKYLAEHIHEGIVHIADKGGQHFIALSENKHLEGFDLVFEQI